MGFRDELIEAGATKKLAKIAIHLQVLFAPAEKQRMMQDYSGKSCSTEKQELRNPEVRKVIWFDGGTQRT